MIDPITREEILLAKALGENVPDIVPIIRKEMYLAKIAGADISTPEAITREEMYLDAIANGTECTLAPITRKEMFYAKAAGQDVQTPAPITRIEMLLSQIAGSGGGGEQPVYHTVKFYNGDVLLGSVQVLHGKSASYTGDTPVKGEGYEFNGWNPAPTNVTADMDCYAQFKDNNIYTWDAVATACADGTYKDVYKLGDLVPLDLGEYGVYDMEIVAFDVDDKADGSGKAPITWIVKKIVVVREMNPSDHTGVGWAESATRALLRDTVYNALPDAVKSSVVPVTKTFKQCGQNTILTCEDSLWIPSCREIFNQFENSGAVYTDFFKDNTSRTKYNGLVAAGWWLRTGAALATAYMTVGANGAMNNSVGSTKQGVVFGFCT